MKHCKSIIRSAAMTLGALGLCLSPACRSPRDETAGKPASSIRQDPLPLEASPFGFHPANVPPELGGGDAWACAREIGVRWHRPTVYAFWFRCRAPKDPAHPTGFHWDKLDSSVRGIPKGIHVLWNLSARFGTPEDSFLPKDMAAYREYVRAVVERYDGDGYADAPHTAVVHYWQVENEPNLTPQARSPQSYARLLEETRRVARRANPRCRIVIGGVGGWTGSGPGSSLNGFRRFYRPVLRALRGRGFDIFDYHWYGNAVGDYRAYGQVHREVRAALDANGFAHVPIWITEMGSYSGRPRGLPLQTEAQQAADLLKRYVYPISLGVQKVFWAFGLVEGFGHRNGYFDHTGLIYDGEGPGDRGRGVRKLAYYTYQLMTEKLEGKRFTGGIRGLPDHVFGYRFGRGLDQVSVLWWDWWHEPAQAHKRVRLPFQGKARVTSAITDSTGRRRTWLLRARQGYLTMEIGHDPVFLEKER